jgi:hypothetical protein
MARRGIILLLMLFSLAGKTVRSQFLSHLDATRQDALYTIYAAPPERSEYKCDQAYRFLFNDTENAPEMVSKDGLNFGIAYRSGNDMLFRLLQFQKEPVITTSYSDLVSYYYYPVDGVRVELCFDVYSSREVIAEINIRNENIHPVEFEMNPYVYYSGTDTLNDIDYEGPFGFYSFPLSRKRDGWMVEHAIPFEEASRGFAGSSLRFDRVISFVSDGRNNDSDDSFRNLKAQLLKNRKGAQSLKGILFQRNFRIYPRDEVRFRMVFGGAAIGMRIPELGRRINALYSVDLEKVKAADESAYQKIPSSADLKNLLPEAGISGRDLQYFWWSCFSLLRQCMMPPEGKCSHNYYIFSREPKWGWGYGGQVLHESLSMLAYAYMDPEGAMNSQRVYMDRQRPDGYINYRTGPYLDETIEYNGKPTSSAPWFNYENLEIYRITKDRKFLEEAYRSGSKFYRYYTAERDSNQNGLCEWGAEASLESVRDARVAVWDRVGWPSNFEGPDLNSMLVKEAMSLAEMAGILGLKTEAADWSRDSRERADRINSTMWDPQDGFYYNVNRDDQSFSYKTKDRLKIKEIIGFLPLWAGICDKEQTDRLMGHLTDPSEFWRPNGVPTLSAGESYYNPMGYWNGPVWVQWDYLVFRGLLDSGKRKEAEELAGLVIGNMINLLKDDHVFWEFYSPDDREAGWNTTYIWAGIAARFLIDLR